MVGKLDINMEKRSLTLHKNQLQKTWNSEAVGMGSGGGG